MASIFISYSSLDHDAARQLAGDLKHYGHVVWYDEWQIKVGQCIPTEIERGIEGADFVVLLLSANAVRSNWVDREWKTAYWDEVNKNSVVVLPVLLEDCEIPKLIQTKKYADLRPSYAIGFHQLVSDINWYSQQKGLTTSYEKSTLELPRIIRGSNELTVLTCRQLNAKSNRMEGRLVAVNDARVFATGGAAGDYVQFTLLDLDQDLYIWCYVLQDTPLEDIILEKPRGNFYGMIQRIPETTRLAFIVSEYEPSS